MQFLQEIFWRSCRDLIYTLCPWREVFLGSSLLVSEFPLLPEGEKQCLNFLLHEPEISKPCHYRVCLVCFAGACSVSWTNIAIVTRWLLGWCFLNVPSWLHCRFINVAWNTSLLWLVSWISASPELEKILISKILVSHQWTCGDKHGKASGTCALWGH